MPNTPKIYSFLKALQELQFGVTWGTAITPFFMKKYN
tara:strand:- start:85 stop:195 length:111 start_codon:yes stop_codon:yes gene_type:complete